MAVTRAAALRDLPVEALRAERVAARRELELAVLRARQRAAEGPDAVAELRARVEALTAELVTRYQADLTLVDSLLEPAYPAKVSTDEAAGRSRVRGAT